MAFDPTLPFEEVDEFEPVNEELTLKPVASSFDINQPFEEVDESSIGTQASVPSQYKYDPARFRPRGLTAPKAEEKPEDQGILRQVADIPLGIARGGVTGIKMMTDILGADNAVSKSLSGIEGYMADLMSAQAKEDQQEISRIMKDAEDKGFGEQVKAGIKAFSIAPVDIMSQALGTMAPVIATGLAGSAAKLGALGMRAVQAGVGAGMGAGMIKGEIYNEVKNELVNSGIAEDAAEKAAVEAQSYGGKNLDQILLGAGLGAASTLGAEGIITRILTKQGTAPAAGVVSRVLKGGLTEAAPEAAQAAQEQLAKNVALQREGFDVDPSRGVVAAATMEAVAAAPLGGIAGAVERPAPIKTLAEENLEQTNEIARKVAENGAPLTASAIQDQAATNLRQDELAKQLEAQLEDELVAVKEPTAAPPAIKSKEEFTSIYSQVAPEELDAAEAGFTNVLATAATEEARANAQNALEAIKEVKATVTPLAPPVEPTITPAEAAQPTPTYATQEIIQPEGVRPEPQARTEIETEEAGISDSLQPTARGEEEGQVIFGLRSVADNTATREQISALSEAGLVDIVKGKPVINEDGAAILAQPVAPAIVEQESVTTPAPAEAVTPAPIAEAPVAAPVEQVVTPPVEAAPTITEPAPVTEQAAPAEAPAPEVAPVKEAIISVDKTESFNQELEQKKDFNPPAIPSLQDARSVPDKVAKKGNTLSISGGSQEAVILNNEKAKKKFDAIGYDRQEIALPDDINEKVSEKYGQSISNIKSIYSPTWLGAHFHGGIAVSKDVKGTQRGRIVAHELGHASHSLLGDQINKDQEVLNELSRIEELIYPGLREKIQSSNNPDTRFFNYLLSADELIAEFNVERIKNPEKAAQVAPKLTSLLESVEKDKRLVADRKAFPVILGAIRETKERLKVKGLEPRQIKTGTMDVLSGKYRQWSNTARFVIDRAKSGQLKIAKVGLKNLKTAENATKEFVKRTAELSGSPELMDYFNELYAEVPPTPAVSETITEPAATPAVIPEREAAPTPEAAPAPAEITVGSRVRKTKGGRLAPNTYIIQEVLPQTEAEIRNNEQSYLALNEQTGNVEDLNTNDGPVLVKGKGARRMAAKPTPLPDNERYGQVKLNRRVQSYFGGKIPDRVYVVDDAVDEEYEYKAAYYPDEGILILNNAFIRKNENIGDIIAHELGHYAFGDAKFKAAFDEFYNSLTPEEKADIDKLMGDSYNNETEESQMEERKVIAFTSFTIATPQRRSLWNAVLDAMKAFLNRVFGKNFKMSDPTRTALAMLATAKRRFAAGEEIVREDIQARKMAAQTQDARFAELEARAKAGDKEAEAEAQRMVDEAAKEAGYVLKGFHGSPEKNITQFKNPTWIAKNKSLSQNYSESFEGDEFVSGKVYTVAVEPGRTLKLWRFKDWVDLVEKLAPNNNELKNEIIKSQTNYAFGMPAFDFDDPDRWNKISRWAKENRTWDNFKKTTLENRSISKRLGQEYFPWNTEGYDLSSTWREGFDQSTANFSNQMNLVNALFDLGYDTLGQLESGRTASTDAGYLVKNPSSQIKSADPFTYDDAGNLIPLSERFQPTTPDIRRMAAEAEPRRVQVGGAVREESKYITTPKGILAKNTDVIREKFFDSRNVSPENTTKAWGYISRLLDIKSGNARAFAGEINDTVDAELEAQRQALIDAGDTKAAGEKYEKEIAAAMFSVELMNYAGKLAAQGDRRMIKFLNRNINDMPTGGVGSVSQAGDIMRTRREYDVDGYGALKAEQQGKTDRTAATLFGKTNPSKDQVNAVEEAIKESDRVELGDAGEVASEIEKVEKRTGRKIIKKIDEKIKESKNPKKDELLISFQNLNQQEKLTGVKTIYKPQKIDPAKNIKDLIIGKLVNYRKTLIKQGADGLESTFWQTMSDQERKPGPLGEIDQAQNNELAKIVQKTLIDLGLKGEPPNTKMTDIEKVASILNKQLLGEEKKILADSKIVAEIERRRQSEIETSGDEDAVNQKYDAILDAWNQAMSRQTNMPISDNMLQRLINAELKEQKFGISDLVEEADGKIVAERKNDIVKSILSRIYKVSKEAETGVEMDEDYNNLERYLSHTLNNMYDLHVQKKNAAFAKRKARIESLQSPEVKAQAVLDSLSRELDEAPPFPQGSENVIRGIVQQDLRQNPDMGREQPWKSQLTGKLLQAGATEYQAETIANLVWRQHQIKAMDRELNEMKVAAEEGSLKVIIQRIKDTPLEKQQEAGWRESVIKDYLISAGLDSKAAETAAKLYDSVISERLAEAKQKAFEDTLKRSAPWKDYQARNSRLAKDALDKIRVAIRTGVLDPEQTTEDIIARENGWTGFTKEQYQRIVQLDSIINNPENDDVSRREAMAQLNQIIVDAKLPVRFKDALGAYYVGNALMGIPTVTVNIASPIGFTVRNLMTDIGRYAFTDPARIPIAFESFLDSMRSWYDQTSYAFKNQIYLNDVVEYLQGQNVLRELFDKGKKQWANGEYAAGFVNMAVGMTQITGRVLSSLDQGAIAMLENQNITRYAMEALAGNTKGRVPKDKLKEFANMVLHTKRRVIAESVASGMPRDRAGVLADLAVKSEVIAALATTEAGPASVLDAAINDALLSVGRNKAITIKGAEDENINLSDEGMLSYLPISFLQTIASGAARQGSGMQIFSKMLYGFALVPARVFHNVAWFSPYGFIRLGVDAYKKSKGQDSPYAMSLQTDAQFKQRLTDAIAGSIVMLGLAALRAGSSDDEDDKQFKIVITGNGPSATTDRQYYDSWNKKWKPYSIHIVVGDTIIPINIGRGGEALFFPIMLAGAMDDWEIKKKQNDTKKEPEDLSAMASMLGSSFFALAQRGPYAAFTKPLFDASKDGRVTEELASQAGYFGKTFIPFLGTSVARNITDFINDPVDRSSVEGAIYANTPIVGPWMGAKALNALGQPARADDWGDKLYKLGVPVVFSFPKDTPMNELNELILKQGSGPTFPTRTNAQKRFGDILTDKEFETYVREYGKVMSDRMFKNRTKLARMKSSDYDDELEKYARGYSAGDFKIKGASDAAVQAVKRMRQ